MSCIQKANSSKVKLIKLDSAEKYQRLLSKELGTSGIKSGHVVLMPGENIGEHTTDEREEVIIVLKGNGEAIIGKDNILKIENDIVLYIPPKTLHDIKNTGSDKLEYIFVTSFAI